MGRMLLFHLVLFLIFSSSHPLQNPSQTPLQNSLVSAFKEDQSASNRGEVEKSSDKIGCGEEIRRVRLQGHAGGHGGGRGHGSSANGGGGGVMSHHNNDKDSRHGRGINGCTTNHIGFLPSAFLVFPMLFLL